MIFWIYIGIVLLIVACHPSGKENHSLSKDNSTIMEGLTQPGTVNLYVITNNKNSIIDTLILNEAKTHYSKRIEKEKIKLHNSNTQTEIQNIVDSILNHYQSEFDKDLEYYKNENMLDKLVEKPAELNLTTSYSILNNSLVSFKIEIAENFPMGTMYPYHKTIPINYSISNNKILTNEEILNINDPLIDLIKERFSDPLSENQPNDSLTINNIIKKGDFKILLTNKELILYFYDMSLEEEDFYSFTFDEIYNNLQTVIKNLVEVD